MSSENYFTVGLTKDLKPTGKTSSECAICHRDLGIDIPVYTGEIIVCCDCKEKMDKE